MSLYAYIVIYDWGQGPGWGQVWVSGYYKCMPFYEKVSFSTYPKAKGNIIKLKCRWQINIFLNNAH